MYILDEEFIDSFLRWTCFVVFLCDLNVFSQT